MAPPLGISVNGDADGVFVTKVKDEGAAKESGVVEAGMKIISIDGQNVVGKDKKGVVGVMKTITGAVPFVLAKPVPGATLPKGSVKMAKAPAAAKAAAPPPAAAAAPPTPTLADNEIEVTMAPPLGISVNGDAATGICITKVKDEGAAKESGVVEAGMKIISIDGQNVVGKDKKGVVGVMKTITGAVPFVLAKPAANAAADLYGPAAGQVEAKTPVTRLGSSAKSSDMVRVSLASPLGLSIGGDAASGISITKVKDGGSAKDSGVVDAGMKIISVDGVSMVGKDKKGVATAIKGIVGAGMFELQKQDTRAAPTDAAAQVITVLLAAPLGFSVNGTQTEGIFVTRLKPGSALSSGKVSKGMKLVSIGDTDVTGKDKKAVLEMIKAANGPTTYGFQEAAAAFAAYQSSAKAEKSASVRVASPHLKPEVGNDAVATKTGGTKPIVVSITIPLGLKFEHSPAAKGIIVVSMKKGSNAEKTGKSLVGMKVLAINNTVLTEQHTKKEANEMVKASNEVTKLKVQFEETGAAFVKQFKATKKGSGKKSRTTAAAIVTAKLAPPLGLSIAGNADSGIFVTKVKDTGSAADAGTVKVGMRLETINGTSCVGLEKKEVVVLMKAIKGSTDVGFVLDTAAFADFQASGSGQRPSTTSLNVPAVPAQPTSMAEESPIYDNGEGDESERKGSMYDNDQHGEPLYDNGEGAEQESTYDNEKPAGVDGDVSTMSRLAIIKMLKAKKIDYSEIDSSDINALRALAAAMSGP